MNKAIDDFASKEPIDYHPGTQTIVRDLIHPSLYPLIIDPTSIDTNKHNHFGRKYESSRFQWLPAEVDIDSEGKATFVSPINNFTNPQQYPQMQTALNNVMTALIPGFEKVWQYSQMVSFNSQEDWDEADEYPQVDPVSFKNSRLQVIVKVAEYTFQPNMSFSGVWHYEGMAHENIVMTGLFYPYTDERLQGGGLEFKRQFTDVDGNFILYNVAQTRPVWLDEAVKEGFVPLGQCNTDTGLLMVFPNCHAHRVMDIVNKTNEVLKRRLIVFFVVDPMQRIVSSADCANAMPRTLIADHEVALKDRLELMQERKYAKQQLNPREIELCEH